MVSEHSGPSEDSLVVAIQENWAHARHVENSRGWHLNLFMAATAAVLAVIFQEGPASVHNILSRYWIVFVFLFVFSTYTFLAVTKLNLEFQNHIRAIQWASEELQLNRPISEKGGYRYRGYMALPLPVGIRRRAIFEFFTVLMVGGTLGASLAGLIFDRMRDLANWICGPCVPQPDMVRLTAYSVAAISLFLTSFVLYMYAKRQEDKANSLIDSRKPNHNRVGRFLAQFLGSPQNQAIIALGIFAWVLWTWFGRLQWALLSKKRAAVQV